MVCCTYVCGWVGVHVAGGCACGRWVCMWAGAGLCVCADMHVHIRMCVCKCACVCEMWYDACVCVPPV